MRRRAEHDATVALREAGEQQRRAGGMQAAATSPAQERAIVNGLGSAAAPATTLHDQLRASPARDAASADAAAAALELHGEIADEIDVQIAATQQALAVWGVAPAESLAPAADDEPPTSPAGSTTMRGRRRGRASITAREVGALFNQPLRRRRQRGRAAAAAASADAGGGARHASGARRVTPAARVDRPHVRGVHGARQLSGWRGGGAEGGPSHATPRRRRSCASRRDRGRRRRLHATDGNGRGGVGGGAIRRTRPPQRAAASRRRRRRPSSPLSRRRICSRRPRMLSR